MMWLRLRQWVPAARTPLVLTIVLALLGTLALIGQMALLAWIVSDASLSRTGLQLLWPLLLLLLAAGVVRAVLAGAREVAAQHAAVCVKTTLRVRLFAHVLHLGPSSGRNGHR